MNDDFTLRMDEFDGLSTPIDEYPEIYDYAAARGAFWTIRESEILLGVNGQGAEEIADLDSDSPHILISASSGAGKSVTARSIATQALVKGFEVVFLDIKRHSHRWAKNLPGVHYAGTLPEIASALKSLGVHLHKRNEIVNDYPGAIADAPVGPRIMVVFEEMNATLDALSDFEKQMSRTELKPSRAFGDVMFLGRAAKISVVAISQYAKAVMRPAILTNFGTRILINHDWETWAGLVPRSSSTGGQPPAPPEVGRGHNVVGGRPAQLQLLFIGEEESAQIVRDAYDARVRAGLVKAPSKRQVRKYERAAIAATVKATGLQP